MNRCEINKEALFRKSKEKSPVKNWGAYENTGRRLRMLDRHTIIPGFRGRKDEFFAGVYDGHYNIEAARFAAENLHLNLAKELKNHQPAEALKLAFLKTDQQIKENNLAGGTTAAVVYLNDNNLYAANVGDSRVLLVSNDEEKQLSYDHKAIDDNEKKRIETLGGTISTDETPVERVNGIISVTRSLGDHDNPKINNLIIADPYISETKITTRSQIIIGSDGLWDEVDNYDAGKIVRAEKDPHEAAEWLAETALNRISKDNITAIVIEV